MHGFRGDASSVASRPSRDNANLLLIFLYEPEEKKINDALARWWVTFDDLGRAWESSTLDVGRNLGQIVRGWLDGVFGREIRAWRMFSTAICLSLSSIWLLSFGFCIFTWVRPITQPISVGRALVFLAAGTLMFLGATSRRHVEYDEITRTITAAAGTLVGVAFFSAPAGRPQGFLLGLLVGVGCHYIVVSSTRLVASWAVGAKHWFGFVALAVVNAAAGLGALIAPMVLADMGRLGGTRADIVGFGTLSNMFGGIVAASFAIVATGLALQKFAWPFISRPLYALSRFPVFNNRRWLFLVGTALLATAVPGLAKVREDVVALFFR